MFINNLRISNTSKIQLKISNNFISSIDNDEERVMHSESDNIEIMVNDEADKVMNKFFDSITNRYENNLELLKVSEFVYDYDHLWYYKWNKINVNRGPSCIDFPDWIINKKATMNLINKKDNKYYQSAITVALFHEEIK